MKIILPILAGFALLLACPLSAQPPLPQPSPSTATVSPVNPVAPAANVASSPTPADWMQRAVDLLDRQTSVASKVRYRVDMLGHAMIGSGEYTQQGRGEQRMFRLGLKMQVAENVRIWEQVNDGRYLWQYQDLSDPPKLERLDFRRVHQALERSGRLNLNTASPSQMISLGGLPKLMVGLNDSFEFVSVQAGKLDSQPVVTLEGRWKPARLALLLPGQKADIEAGKPAKLNKLPAHQPDSVLICLSRDDLFPYRLEFRRQALPGSLPGSERSETKILMAMEWYEVRLGGALDPQQFRYQPGGTQPTDITDPFLKSMGLSADGSTLAATPAPAAK